MIIFSEIIFSQEHVSILRTVVMHYPASKVVINVLSPYQLRKQISLHKYIFNVFLQYRFKIVMSFNQSISNAQDSSVRTPKFNWGFPPSFGFFDLTVSEKNISRTSPRGPSSASNSVWFLPSAFTLWNLISSVEAKACLLFRPFESQNPALPFIFLCKVWCDNREQWAWDTFSSHLPKWEKGL